MASRKITIDNLSDEIKKILDEYGDEVYARIDEVGRKTASKGRAALKNKSEEVLGNWPSKHEDNPKKKYANGWSVTSTAGRLYFSYEIHNRTNPTLTHLLEYGHALNRGGRAKAYPHIDPVAEALPDDFQKDVINEIQGIS